MCKKSKFPLVFNIFLAFFITLVVTIFVKAGEGALTPESFIIGMIQGFCLNMTLETIIDLPAMGNKFVLDSGKTYPPRAMARGGMFYPVAASRRESRRTASREKSRR